MFQDGQNPSVPAIPSSFLGLYANSNSQPTFSVKDPAGNILVVPSLIFCALSSNFTGTNATGAQPVFNATASGAITVAATTTYFVEGIYHITDSGATSHTVSLGFGGTATLTSLGVAVQFNTPTTETSGADSTIWITANPTVVTGAIAAASFITFRLRGIIRVNAAGTLIPQFTFSAAPGSAPTILANSHIFLIPIGSNTVTTAGLWT